MRPGLGMEHDRPVSTVAARQRHLIREKTMFRTITASRGVFRVAALLFAATVAASACATQPNPATGTSATTKSASAPADAGSTSPADDTSVATSPVASDVPNGTDANASGHPAAPVDNAVTITMPGMSYEVSGTLRPGIGSITLANTDDVAHMMAFAHLKDGVTLDQVKDALATSEDALGALLAEAPDTSYGTPDVLGAGQTETITGVAFKPGTFVLACFLMSSDGMPHWQMGMIGELTIEGDPATEKPADSGTIVIDDAGITVPDGFAGHGTYLVTNTGAQPHNLSIAWLDSGTSLADYAGHVGQAMGTGGAIDGGGGLLVGGIDALAPDQSAYITLDLRPGHYGYISSADMTGPELPQQSGEFDVP